MIAIGVLLVLLATLFTIRENVAGITVVRFLVRHQIGPAFVAGFFVAGVRARKKSVMAELKKFNGSVEEMFSSYADPEQHPEFFDVLGTTMSWAMERYDVTSADFRDFEPRKKRLPH